MNSARDAKRAAVLPTPAVLYAGATRFMELERAVDEEYLPQMLQALQVKVEAKSIQGQVPRCVHCGQAMSYRDKRSVSWLARSGKLWAQVSRYRCAPCHYECVRCWII